MAEASLGEVPSTISPIAVAPKSRSITLPADVAQLWEKANKALEELLATKSSIEAHRQKAVWELGMELCWNDSETAESIKEATAVCTHAVQEAKLSALQPSGKLRPEGPPRLNHSTGNMPSPSNTWRSKSSKRKARVRLTFSLLVKLP